MSLNAAQYCCRLLAVCVRFLGGREGEASAARRGSGLNFEFSRDTECCAACGTRGWLAVLPGCTVRILWERGRCGRCLSFPLGDPARCRAAQPAISVSRIVNITTTTDLSIKCIGLIVQSVCARDVFFSGGGLNIEQFGHAPRLKPNQNIKPGVWSSSLVCF